MNNYVSIIKRSDFNDLYKYGHLYVHDIIPYEGNLADHADDKLLFEALTQHMNTYEYSTEYIVISLRKAPFCGTSVEVFIKDVLSVYALDADAKASLSVSLDPRINIQVSCWSDYFVYLNKKQQIRQANAGIFNCFEIFNITNDDRNLVKSILKSDLIETVFDELYSRKRPSGQKPIWHYLLRYERHSPYWNDARGFFSDAIHAFENYKAQKEIDYEIADELPVGDIICACPDDFLETYHKVISCANSDYCVSGCDYLAVAPLFLYMHSLFRDGGISPTKLSSDVLLSNSNNLSQFGRNFAIAVGLLGIVLGQDNTYSCYYEIKQLNIFRKNMAEEKENLTIYNPETGQNLSKEEAETLISSLTRELSDLKKAVQSQEMSDVAIVANNQTLSEEAADETESVSTPPAEIIIADNIQSLNSSDIVLPLTIDNDNTDVNGNVEAELEFEPIFMRKLKKGRKEFNQKVNPVCAHTLEEYNNYIKKGYEREDYFTPGQIFNNE